MHIHRARVGRLAVVAGVAAAAIVSSGCSAYFNAVLSPMQVTESQDVPGLRPGGAVDAAAYTIEAKSSNKSHISGRNNLTLTAALQRVDAGEVVVLVHLASTTRANVDPNNFYVYFDGGSDRVRVDSIALGELVSKPYDYTVKVPIRVDAGEIRYEGGGVARLYKTEMVNQRKQEPYYMRTAELVFRGDGLVEDAPERLVLELRDLGVNMQIVWRMQEVAS